MSVLAAWELEIARSKQSATNQIGEARRLHGEVVHALHDGQRWALECFRLLLNELDHYSRL